MNSHIKVIAFALYVLNVSNSLASGPSIELEEAKSTLPVFLQEKLDTCDAMSDIQALTKILPISQEEAKKQLSKSRSVLEKVANTQSVKALATVQAQASRLACKYLITRKEHGSCENSEVKQNLYNKQNNFEQELKATDEKEEQAIKAAIPVSLRDVSDYATFRMKVFHYQALILQIEKEKLQQENDALQRKEYLWNQEKQDLLKQIKQKDMRIQKLTERKKQAEKMTAGFDMVKYIQQAPSKISKNEK